MSPITAAGLLVAPLQSGLVPRGTRVEVFQQIYLIFLGLGTLVGIIVIGYMLLNAYKYREGRPDMGDDDVDRPQLGELPQGGGGGKKLFLSFSLSAIVVISLIVWTYGTLLYVEEGPNTGEIEGEEQMVVKVVGHQFYWQFQYMNVPGQQSGVETENTLRVPKGVAVQLRVTSGDVFHNFGVPSLRVKSDAIPGRTTDSWFIANETGRYHAACFELCGVGHSSMIGEVIVMEQQRFDQWYASQNVTAGGNQSGGNQSAGNSSNSNSVAPA